MIDHHAMAIMVAEKCLDDAAHEELRFLCEEIIAAQSAEIEEMQSWRQEWYGLTYEPEMQSTDQMDKRARFEGAEFESAFMEMIKHHEKAIKEAKRCLDRADHAELQSRCQHIVATQNAEIAQMQTWLCEWYGLCKREP